MLERRAALLRLLGRAFHDLGRQVAGVELGDRAHDPVQQQAGRGLVDVLGRGDEEGAGGADLHRDLDVVGSGAGEAVDLVDDHGVDVAVLDPVEQGAEAGAVRGLRGFAAVDELLDYLEPERGLLCAAQASRWAGIENPSATAAASPTGRRATSPRPRRGEERRARTPRRRRSRSRARALRCRSVPQRSSAGNPTLVDRGEPGGLPVSLPASRSTRRPSGGRGRSRSTSGR